MSATDFITITKGNIDKINLTENYRDKGFTRNFNFHLDSLIQTSIELTGEENSVFNDKDVKMTNSLYWQTEANILEKLDDVTDNDVLDELDNLEDILRDKIILSLGKNYDKSSTQNKMIDVSVHNVLMSVKYNYFSQSPIYLNPWEFSKNILFDNSILHTFTNNIEELYEFGLKLNDKESLITRYNRIGILGKGNKKDYATGFVRDLMSLRNTLFDLLDSEGHNSSKPIKILNICDKIRRLGIDATELSDSNIKNWLVGTLKRSNKLGSCREGFFVIKDCKDLQVSYDSHLENLKGYYRTLESHRKISEKLSCSDFNFDEHNDFLNKK